MYAQSSLFFSGNFSLNTQAYLISETLKPVQQVRHLSPAGPAGGGVAGGPFLAMGHTAPLGLDVVLQQLGHVPLLNLVGQFGRNCWEAFTKDEWLHEEVPPSPWPNLLWPQYPVQA